MAFDSFYNESKLNNFNSTRFASQVITSSFSMLCYVVVFVLSVLGVCFKSIRKFLASPARHIFFLIAGILTSVAVFNTCLLYTSPSPRDLSTSRMPSSA